MDKELKKLLPPEILPTIIECLEDDPRPSYHEDGREYGMRFASYNVKFIVNDLTLKVTSVEKIEN